MRPARLAPVNSWAIDPISGRPFKLEGGRQAMKFKAGLAKKAFSARSRKFIRVRSEAIAS